MGVDSLKIDSHKLMYHVDRVGQWLKDKSICPIYVEIGPSGSCNHRCIFCAFDYVGYKKVFLDTKVLKRRLLEMAKGGVKSILYSGEGEPLLHKDMADIILHTKRVGIDAALATNGVLLDKNISQKCLSALTWVKVSLNAGTKQTHAKIHCCNKGDFDRIIQNLKDAVRIKKKRKLACTIGVQMLFLPENCNEVAVLASILKKIGVDYLVVKPFSQHPMSRHKLSKSFHYKDYFRLEEKLNKYSNKNFKVVFRLHTMEKIEGSRAYKHCFGIPFWAHIDATGNVWACSARLGNPNYLFGNIYSKSFKAICNSKRRRDIINRISTKLDTSVCRKACRLDEINSYLWELKHLVPHVNFI